jgi:hypothetical protein
MAGYSGTPLIQKIGFKANTRYWLVAAPPTYRALLGALPEGAVEPRKREALDLIHLFSVRRSVVDQRIAELRDALAPKGMLWISWPKKSAGVETDLDEHAVRRIGLAAGLVDVKVCAVDETWSGLKFMFRRADRPR